MNVLEKLCNNFMRVKRLDHDLLTTPLLRCLSTVDLYFFGVGCMMAVGVYVLNGSIVSYDAGPAACISFLIAGFAASLSALCYAEFAARIPKAGSAYIYCYTTIGEFWAFIVGWNIILEYLLGVAVLARGWSSVIRHFIWGTNDVWKFMYTKTNLSESRLFLNHPDYLAFGIIILTAIILISGAKPSIRFSSMLTTLNLGLIIFTTIVAFCYGDIKNLTTPRGDLPFLPRGIEGVLNGAAKAFFAYIGFDCIAIAAEEAKNPAYSVPRAILAALGTILLVYMGTSMALASLLPYKLIDPASAFPTALAVNGLPWARYVVLVGSLFGLSTAISGQMFSLPRVVYAMACDGLFFKVFRRVGTWAHIPSLALLASTPVPAILALVLETEALIHFLSLGTLVAYTSVSASVLLFRYQPLSGEDVATLQDYGLLSPHKVSKSVNKKDNPPSPRKPTSPPPPPRLRGEESSPILFPKLGPHKEATAIQASKPDNVVSHLDGLINAEVMSDTDTAMSSETTSTDFAHIREEDKYDNFGFDSTSNMNDLNDLNNPNAETDEKLKSLPYMDNPGKMDPNEEIEQDQKNQKRRKLTRSSSSNLKNIGTLRSRFSKLPILSSCQPGLAVICAVMFHIVFSGTLGGTLVFTRNAPSWTYEWWAILLIIFSTLGIVFCQCVMLVHRKNDKFKTFKVPLVPLIPSLSMLVNVVLMLQLSYFTWLKMVVWAILGIVIYLAYGMRHSEEARRPDVPFPYNLLQSDGEASYSSLGQTLILQQPPNKYQSGHSHVDDEQNPAATNDETYDVIRGPEEPMLRQEGE